MSGLVHVVDDDASFRTAIERRLKFAGYEVETYSSAPTTAGSLAERREARMHPARRTDTGTDRPRTAKSPGRRRFDPADHLPHRTFRHANDGRAIKAGAEDFLTKPVSSEQLIDAIERAMVRFESASSQRSKLDSFRALVTTLTPRERQVFDLIVRGKINKQIAYELGTTERTVKAHRHQVMEKMQVNSLAALVSIAERLDMLDHEA